jgi:hypothetical protein
MNEHKQFHPGQGPGSDRVHPGKGPYWKRAHHDWRFWIALVLMFAAMIIYLMSDDLAWRPGLRPRQPVPTVGQQ